MFYHGIGKTTDFSIFVTICFQWFLYELNSIIFLTCGTVLYLNVSSLVVRFHFRISLFGRFTYFHKNLKKEMCLLSRPGEKRTFKNRLEKMIGFIFKFSVLYKNLNLPMMMFFVLKYFWGRHQHPRGKVVIICFSFASDVLRNSLVDQFAQTTRKRSFHIFQWSSPFLEKLKGVFKKTFEPSLLSNSLKTTTLR